MSDGKSLIHSPPFEERCDAIWGNRKDADENTRHVVAIIAANSVHLKSTEISANILQVKFGKPEIDRLVTITFENLDKAIKLLNIEETT